jgi:hypothetical protein
VRLPRLDRRGKGCQAPELRAGERPSGTYLAAVRYRSRIVGLKNAATSHPPQDRQPAASRARPLGVCPARPYEDTHGGRTSSREGAWAALWVDRRS